MAIRCHRKYAISVNSCSQALVFSQLYLQNISKQESRVIIPGISFVATLNSVLLAGNSPVYCDVDSQALIDLGSLDFAINAAGVNCIMYTNLFGNVVDYDKFVMHTEFFNKDIFVIEDAAQSFGASYKGTPSGKLGNISCLSFDPTKNLPNYGSGGMILTDDDQVYEFCTNMKNNGKQSNHYMPGTNSKLSEVDCAQMLVKLRHFDSWQRRRTKIADYYSAELKNLVDVPEVNSDVHHAWHKYVIRYVDRAALQEHLLWENIETKIHYMTPLFEHNTGFMYSGYRDTYRESNAFCVECLSLPIYPELTDTEVELIVDKIKNYIF
jgi:dTDP-4-amino-4,6-dideoxygalactose transaminase